MSLYIRTRFYDEAQRELFRSNYAGHFAKLEELIEADLNEFSYSEFQAYFLFVRWRKDDPTWGSFQGIRKRVSTHWVAWYDLFYYNEDEKRFNSLYPDNNEQSADSEMVGVASGLTVVSKLHDLTEADWEKIPVGPKPDLDYKIASTGENFLYLECKGTIAADNSGPRKPNSVYNHKSSIDTKKNQQRPLPVQKPGIFYGTITVVDPTNHLLLWFVDPPEPDNSIDPRKYKLLSRLYYYYRNLNALYQRSPFVVALINRIVLIQKFDNYNQFDKQPLVTVNGENYVGSKIFLQGFSVERETTAGPVFGKLLLIGKPDATGQLFFFGFLRSVLDVLSAQNFEDILTFSSTTPGRARRSKRQQALDFDQEEGFSLTLQVSRNSPEGLFLKAIGKLEQKESQREKTEGPYITVRCRVDLEVSSAGRAFGMVRQDSISVR